MTILPPEQQSSASSASYTKKKSAEKVVDLKSKEAVRPHAKIPHEDLDWILNQSPTTMRFFIECWRCDSFGSPNGKQWHNLETKLKGENLRKTMRSLEKPELFKFRRITEVIDGKQVTTGWQCQNLHGYYNKTYWNIPTENCDTPTVSGNTPTENCDTPTVSGDTPTENCDTPTVSGIPSPEITAQSGFEKVQLLPNHSSTTYQQPTKVVGRVVGIPQETETPLGGAPTNGGMLEEKKDVTISHSPSVEDKPEVAGDEPKDPGGDNFSAAAPGAENEKLSVVAAAPPLSEPQANSLLHLDMGSAIRLDFEGHQRHGRYGKIVAVDFEVGEAEVEFRIDQLVIFNAARRLPL